MKTLIRQKAFETNSSSSHSISLGKDEGKEIIYDSLYPNENGILYINGKNFGWEWEKYNDVETKVAYAATSIKYGLDFELLYNILKEQTGAKEIIFDCEDNYIDHQSVDTCPTDKESLKDFLFNKNSWLFTGNDNSPSEYNFYDVPIISSGKIIEKKYNYELKIRGINQTAKFENYPSEEELINAINAIVSNIQLNSYGFIVIDYSGKFIPINIQTRIAENLIEFENYSKIVDLAKKEFGDNWNWEKTEEIRNKVRKDKNYIQTLKFSINEI